MTNRLFQIVLVLSKEGNLFAWDWNGSWLLPPMVHGRLRAQMLFYLVLVLASDVDLRRWRPANYYVSADSTVLVSLLRLELIWIVSWRFNYWLGSRIPMNCHFCGLLLFYLDSLLLVCSVEISVIICIFLCFFLDQQFIGVLFLIECVHSCFRVTVEELVVFIWSIHCDIFSISVVIKDLYLNLAANI